MNNNSVLGDGANTMELKQFIELASKSFALPQFQRPPTWDWNHQRDLLESIFQPIGSIMIWERNEERIPKSDFLMEKIRRSLRSSTSFWTANRE